MNDYFLEVGAGFLIQDETEAGKYSNCFRVWPHDCPMPPFYGYQEILSASSLETIIDEKRALERSEELGEVPVYWMRHENNGKTLAVTRIK